MYVSDFLMSHAYYVIKQLAHTLYIVGAYCRTATVYVVNCDNRYVAAHQFLHLIVLKPGTYDYDSIEISVLTVLQV